MNIELLRASIEEKTVLDFTRSGGPGGQNVNKVNSKVIARVRLADLEGLRPAEAALAAQRLEGKLTRAEELVVQADEERDQVRNRAAALERLFAIIAGAARIPKRRVATKPTRASKERRLSSKRARSDSKRNRKSQASGDD
jgi:ribosome-associated protein